MSNDNYPTSNTSCIISQCIWYDRQYQKLIKAKLKFGISINSSITCEEHCSYPGRQDHHIVQENSQWLHNHLSSICQVAPQSKEASVSNRKLSNQLMIWNNIQENKCSPGKWRMPLLANNV